MVNCVESLGEIESDECSQMTRVKVTKHTIRHVEKLSCGTITTIKKAGLVHRDDVIPDCED